MAHACYIYRDKEIGKVIIPNCMSVIYSDDIKDCTCIKLPKMTKVEKLEEKIWHLEKENEKLRNQLTNTKEQ